MSPLPKKSEIRKAYLLNKNREIKKKIWEISDKAHHSIIDKGFYINYYNGCCGAERTYSYYDLESGRKIFSTTCEILKYNSPIKDVFISYQALSSSKDFTPCFIFFEVSITEIVINKSRIIFKVNISFFLNELKLF